MRAALSVRFGFLSARHATDHHRRTAGRGRTPGPIRAAPAADTPWSFRVDVSFTITGRGTGAIGILSGAIGPGPHPATLHTRQHAAIPAIVSLEYAKVGSDDRPALLVREIDKEQVPPGTLIGPSRSPAELVRLRRLQGGPAGRRTRSAAPTQTRQPLPWFSGACEEHGEEQNGSGARNEPPESGHKLITRSPDPRPSERLVTGRCGVLAQDHGPGVHTGVAREVFDELRRAADACPVVVPERRHQP